MNPSSIKTDCPEDLSHLKKMDTLISNGYLADCTFIVGPDDDTAETIQGHKMLFIMESPVFEKMLNGHFKEARDSKIRIIDANPHVFKIFRLMIYNKCASDLEPFKSEEIINLYRLCDKYMASSISKLCIESMKNSDFLKKVGKDFITICEIAFKIEDKSLLNSIKQAIANGLVTKAVERRLNNNVRVLQATDRRVYNLSVDAFYEYIQLWSVNSKTPNMASTLFSEIDSYFNKHFEQILFKKDDNITAKDEDEAIQKLNKSETNNSTNIQVKLEKCLGLINFGTFGFMEFQEGPGNSKLLNGEQKYYIVSKLLNKYYCKHHILRTNCKSHNCNSVTINSITLSQKP